MSVVGYRGRANVHATRYGAPIQADLINWLLRRRTFVDQPRRYSGNDHPIQVVSLHQPLSGTKEGCDVSDCSLPVFIMHWEVVPCTINREQLCVRDPPLDLKRIRVCDQWVKSALSTACLFQPPLGKSIDERYTYMKSRWLPVADGLHTLGCPESSHSARQIELC